MNSMMHAIRKMITNRMVFFDISSFLKMLLSEMIVLKFNKIF